MCVAVADRHLWTQYMHKNKVVQRAMKRSMLGISLVNHVPSVEIRR